MSKPIDLTHEVKRQLHHTIFAHVDRNIFANISFALDCNLYKEIYRIFHVLFVLELDDQLHEDLNE